MNQGPNREPQRIRLGRHTTHLRVHTCPHPCFQLGLKFEVNGRTFREQIKLAVGAMSCVVVATGLLEKLKVLPDSAGTGAIVRAIRRSALHGERWAT